MSALSTYLITYLNAYGFSQMAELGIRVATDPKYPNLFNLKYGATSPRGSSIVQACRGAVVEKQPDGTFQLVAYAFDRFFNVGEPECAELDWDTVTAYEKYDGSLIKLFHYQGDWVVSTSGSVAGSSKVGASGLTFAELFWRTFHEQGYKKSDLTEEGVYIWELCCRENRIVVDYPENFIRLIGLRDRTDGFAEVRIELLKPCFLVADGFKADSTGEITRLANERPGTAAEGYVLCDAQGRRAKVKSLSYLEWHKVRGNGQPDFLQLWKNDDLTEFLTYFPSYSAEFGRYLCQISLFSQECQSFLAETAFLSQKEFASRVLTEKKQLASALFALRAGKVSNFPQWLQQANEKPAKELLGLR